MKIKFVLHKKESGMFKDKPISFVYVLNTCIIIADWSGGVKEVLNLIRLYQ